MMSHTVQFYESERFLHRAIERFLAPALHQGDPAVMIARPRTFEAVADRLATGTDFSPLQPLDPRRIKFVDAESTIQLLMDGDMPDPARVEHGFSDIVGDYRRNGHSLPIMLYGEMVDLLCREGRHAAAIAFETQWNHLSAGQNMSSLCGYALHGFDDDTSSVHFRGVCQQHTHIIPAEEFPDPARDRNWCEQVALLQHRTRVRNRVPAPDPARSATNGHGPALPTVYVVDDDASVRRSLARLLSLAEWQVKTFGSGEAFLAEADSAASGCLILDIQLVGMSGIDLQIRMAAAGWRLPVIAMSASQDARMEAEALRLGALAFLRKPFDPQRLLDAVARSLRSRA